MEPINREIIIKSSDNATEIALLENKILVEYIKEPRNKQFNVGDFYIGKVKKIMNGLNAAFVDIGAERDAFLPYHDLGPNFLTYKKFIKTAIYSPKNIPDINKIKFLPQIDKDGKISKVLHPNELLLVQITKESISNKGPRITTEITIPGRYIVLIPFSDKIAISQKIKDKEERERLRQLILSIKPKNFGIIVRTAAQNKKVDAIYSEMTQLVEKWNNIIPKLAYSKKVKLVESEIDRLSAYLRDVLNESFNAIYVDDTNLYYQLKDYLYSIFPHSQKILRYYTGKQDIFSYFGVDKQLKKSFQRIVNLKQGAYLIIEKTEALHVIDVNSGNKTSSNINQEKNAFEVNMIAAEEIARQLRLRDMGGIIVVDFIDMKEQKHRDLVVQHMKKLMAHDRAKHTILPLSKFGLMQITRQRVRPEISIINFEPCPVCNGTGKIGPSILIIDEIENTLSNIKNLGISSVMLKTHPFIHAYLTKGLISKALKWKLKYKINLKVIPDPNYYFLEYNFFHLNGEKISL